MKTLILACALVCVFLTGCTTITTETVNIVRTPIPDTMGRIIVYRKPQFAGSGVFPDLYVDKSDRGALTNASVIALNTTPGEHILAVKGSILTYGFSDVTMIAKVEQGKPIYIEYAVILAGTTGLSNTWQYGFKIVDPAVGAIEVDDLISRVSTQEK